MIASSTKNIRPVWTNDRGSMAEDTAKTRWPRTVEKVAAELSRVAGLSSNDEAKEEGLALAKKVSDIKAEIESDQKLSPLEADGASDISLYNRQLAGFGECSWQAAPWLFSECYLYRRIHVLITNSSHWKRFDIFKQQKDDAFANSRSAVQELAKRYMDVIDSNATQDSEKAHLLFEEMTQIALWGNATDLSLLTNLSLADMDALQGAKAIEKNKRNVIVSDTEAVYRHLTNGAPRSRIDIVLDNSGFEFFTDLIYASYLVHSGLAKHVILHTKSMPWFVSDVTPPDVDTVLDHLERSDLFPERESLDPLAALLRRHFSQGEFSVRNHPFWTTASTFHELPSQAPDLFDDLRRSALVIFKGDLNYRKLTIDGLWPYTTPFGVALGTIGPGSGLPVLALRTNKSDVCVGVAAERVKELDQEAPDHAWVRNGAYAVVSFSKGE